MPIAVPSIELGRGENDEPVIIEADKRMRGTMIVGQPGLGKSALLATMALQDIVAGMPVMFIDPHTGVADLIARIPPARLADVVVISLRHDDAPLWPVLDIARQDDEQLTVAGHLVDAWRAQYGHDSIGARAESVLANSLLAIPRKSGISPVELLAILSLKFYRYAALENRQLNSIDFGLKAYFEGTVGQVGERVFQEWAQSVENKISPLINHPWLRRATTGTPAGRGDVILPPEVLWQPLTSPILRATWVSDGKIVIERDGMQGQGKILIDRQLDDYLLRSVGKGVVMAKAFPEGREADTQYVKTDVDEFGLMWPDKDELNTYGVGLEKVVERRRRRRAWRRMVDYELAPRGIVAREAIDIADLLDDGRIVLIEVPKTSGSLVTQAVATFALLAAVLRGHRQMALPPERRVPVAIYVDEAELFLTSGIVEVLSELRKADVAITLALQRLGQLDDAGAGDARLHLRQGVISTVGTLITMAMGRGEIKEAAALLAVEEEKVRNLERGQGLVSTLTSGWAIGKTQSFHFDALREVVDDLSHPVRKASIKRFHQPVEDADKVFISRVRSIMKTVSAQPPASSS